MPIAMILPWLVDACCKYNACSESANCESRLSVKIATKFVVLLGCLVYLAQPVLAIGYFPAETSSQNLAFSNITDFPLPGQGTNAGIAHFGG